jgi:hypothetical protein
MPSKNPSFDGGMCEILPLLRGFLPDDLLFKDLHFAV